MLRNISDKKVNGITFIAFIEILLPNSNKKYCLCIVLLIINYNIQEYILNKF